MSIAGLSISSNAQSQLPWQHSERVGQKNAELFGMMRVRQWWWRLAASLQAPSNFFVMNVSNKSCSATCGRINALTCRFMTSSNFRWPAFFHVPLHFFYPYRKQQCRQGVDGALWRAVERKRACGGVVGLNFNSITFKYSGIASWALYLHRNL
ncbi:hypothetical protein KC19_2G125400 [Ceratodon purpureus]|uniref:Uncharacterized protein n=1 Tax=Ceratodon purpureus TaxID=3225 RepID=A0A8T0IVQ1_CERPU|nr:hypothetical protein KC19_2G125400 [Ceratodon purpureus]